MIPRPIARLLASGRVELLAADGRMLVVVRAGALHRNVLCPAVEGVEVGDDVLVDLGADLRRGVIRPPAPLRPALPPRRVSGKEQRR